MQQAQGFTFHDIKDFLKKNGYTDQIIEEHFKQLLPNHKPIQPLLIVIGVAALLIIGGGIVFASWFFSQPVCGNGVLEEGENPDTCCVDAGCFGDQTCQDNICVAPTCGECQYLAGNECLDYECCSDDQCGSGFSCQQNRCREVICGFCQYVDGNACTSYECCEDSQCFEGEICNQNTCIPGSRQPLIEETTDTFETLDEVCEYTCCTNADCDDGIESNFDICEDPATPNSFCTSYEI